MQQHGGKPTDRIYELRRRNLEEGFVGKLREQVVTDFGVDVAIYRNALGYHNPGSIYSLLATDGLALDAVRAPVRVEDVSMWRKFRSLFSRLQPSVPSDAIQSGKGTVESTEPFFRPGTFFQVSFCWNDTVRPRRCALVGNKELELTVVALQHAALKSCGPILDEMKKSLYKAHALWSSDYHLKHNYEVLDDSGGIL